MNQVAWSKGVITDYKPATKEHTIVFDINTPDESWEEVNLKCANPSCTLQMSLMAHDDCGKAVGHT